MRRSFSTIATWSLALALGGFVAAPAFADDAEKAKTQVESLATANQTDRKGILKTLRELGEKAQGALIDGLTSTHEAVREDCVLLLSQQGGAGAFDAVAIRLVKAETKEGEEADINTSEPSARVRAAAAYTIGKLAGDDAALKTRAAELLLPLVSDGSADISIRVAAADALAGMARAADANAMSGLLNAEASPMLGHAAVRYFGKLGESDAHRSLLGFLTDKKTVGEGEAAKEVWAFEGADKGWEAVRTAAVTVLVEAKHPEGARLLLEEAGRNTRQQSGVVGRFQTLAKTYGEDLAEPVIAWLREKTKASPNSVTTEMDAVLALLCEAGEKGVTMLIALVDEGEAERKTQLETNPAARNPYEQLLTAAMENARTDLANLGLIRVAETRRALLKVYTSRPEPEGDTKDVVREKIFDALLRSRTPESREALLGAFTSTNTSTVRQAIDNWFFTQTSEDLAPLAPLLKHADEGVRERFVTKLGDGTVPVERARPLLESALEDSSAKVRKQVWRGLAFSEDPAVLDVFARGIKDADPEVAHAAVQSLSSLFLKLKTNDKNKRDLQRKASRMLLDAATTGGGAAIGVAQHISGFGTSVYQHHKEGQQELRDTLRKMVDGDDPDLRCAAAEAMHDLQNPDFVETVRKRLLVEENDVAAAGLLTGISGQIHTLKESPEKLEELIGRCIHWLGYNEGKNRVQQSKMAASQAGALLRSIHSQVDALKPKVLDAARKAIQDGLEEKRSGKFPEPNSPGRRVPELRVGQAIDVLRQINAPGESDLVLDTLVAFKDGSHVLQHAVSYLSANAGSAHRDRISKLDTSELPERDKQNILRQIDSRAGSAG